MERETKRYHEAIVRVRRAQEVERRNYKVLVHDSAVQLFNKRTKGFKEIFDRELRCLVKQYDKIRNIVAVKEKTIH